MRKSNNDSGLTAKRSNRLLVAVLTAVAVSLASCQTTTVIPIDDAYYSSEIENPAPKTQTIQNTPVIQNTQNTPAAPKPSIEYLNVQDTTVTIRIKK